MNEETKTKIENFLKEVSPENVYILDYVDVENIDLENAFESIEEIISDNNGFDVEIIYYSKAIDYLKENDPSLRDSLEIAEEFGYDAGKLNSEILASLLASRNSRDEFYEKQDEIDSFFEDLKEELENEEEETEE